ncbi:DNA topoisomerase I [Candidatus Gottesmanbacteria bacterium RIFCSPLOWO2_01_FULL_39_12b]|uniref:DNA topoisomerase 1 n=1 Tax=Candidatus Gottesmanbacteria bacterium RIFCSPLOWO2_01_FULL_39_12b TaxID=1798388 RepID=A0A1F6AQX4_9BACT|nr:MAG: DNA topoisomerase I [Candidatus Gottesmanbacteria bacterium RIFCSPLOWO2_01_FULL_39_12b]
MLNLVIVESPTKARTLSKFLGKDYRIEATYGHIRDLPKNKLGVEIKIQKDVYDFIPKYQIIPDRKKRVVELKKLVETAQTIVLATDPDREGEAIAWHILNILKPEKQNSQKATFSRIVFHEITESAIHEALKNPKSLDLHLVDAQQARRVLDRLVGYKLSPLLWNKLRKRWLSAGRVQSVTVRLIVEREREIEKFKKEEFWRVFGEFKALEAELIKKGDKKYEEVVSFDLFDGKYTVTKTSISTEREAQETIADIKSPFVVSAVDKKEVKRLPPPPYTTSKLQQEAGRFLGFSSKRTMMLAQKLYEEGYITYHRTDSVNLSEKFLASAKDYIGKEYGKNYHAGYFRRYTTKSKVAQEAHEAIRPTNLEDAKTHKLKDQTELNKDHVRLYDLIWKRALSSQAAEAVFDSTTITITSSNSYFFEAKGSVIKFDGFLKISGRNSEDKILPNVSAGDKFEGGEFKKEQCFTMPPPRYTEGSLIKTLEEKDIGRPSTYAPIISTIQDRQYIEKMTDESGRRTGKFHPTELGYLVTDFLVKYFSEIVKLPFTAMMEEELDDIANGKRQWQGVLSEFFGPFKTTLDKVYKDVERVEQVVTEVGESCPQCSKPLVYRTGKFGKFIACSNFPQCKYTRNIVEKIDIPCPKCKGDIIVKRTKRGKQFYGCGNYPKCTFAAWKKEEIK